MGIKFTRNLCSQFDRLNFLCPKPGETFTSQNGCNTLLILDCGTRFVTLETFKVFSICEAEMQYRRCNIDLKVS